MPVTFKAGPRGIPPTLQALNLPVYKEESIIECSILQLAASLVSNSIT